MPEKKVEFAARPKIKQYAEQMETVMAIIAESFVGPDKDEQKDWLDYCYVSDESTIGDFEACENHGYTLKLLNERLGLSVTRKDYIWEIAARMAKAN